MKAMFLRLPLLALVVLAAACAPISAPPPSGGSWPEPPKKTEPPPAQPKPPEKPREGIEAKDVHKPSPAVQSLLDKGWASYRRKDYQGALGYAERAQRIDARSPDTYLLMASAQFSLYKLSVAEQLARKGIAFSASGSPVYRQLHNLLARIQSAGR